MSPFRIVDVPGIEAKLLAMIASSTITHGTGTMRKTNVSYVLRNGIGRPRPKFAAEQAHVVRAGKCDRDAINSLMSSRGFRRSMDNREPGCTACCGMLRGAR